MSQRAFKSTKHQDETNVSQTHNVRQTLTQIEWGVFDSLVDGVVVVDQQQNFLYANPSAYEMAEISSRRSAKGKKLSALMNFEPDYMDIHLPNVLDATPYREVYLVANNGVRRRVQITVRPLNINTEDSQQFWVIYMHDVTLEERLQKKYMDQLREKEEYIKKLDRKLYETSVLFEIAQGMNLFHELDDILNLILNKLEDAFEFKHSIAGLIDRDHFTTQSFIARTNSRQVALPRSQPEKWVKSFYFKALAQGVPQFFNKNENPELSLFVENHVQTNFDNYLFVPLIHKEQAGFVILVHSKNKKELAWEPTDDDLTLLFGVANQIMSAIDNHNLFQDSMLDSMTGLYNQRYFQDKIRLEFNRSVKTETPLGVLMVDVDFFKKFNDTYGHAVGDLVLKKVAEVIQNACRDSDTAARYGGEEFVVILPDADSRSAWFAGERIRKKIEAQALEVGNEVLHITASVGAASFPEVSHTFEELLEFADQALYDAKHSGRNNTKLFIKKEKSENK